MAVTLSLGSDYVTMTSMDIMNHHRPDDLNLVMGGKAVSSEDIQTQKDALVALFMEDVLKDPDDALLVLSFINEFNGVDVSVALKETPKQVETGIQTVYTRQMNRSRSTSTEKQSYDNNEVTLPISNDIWFSLPFSAVEQNRLDILRICLGSGVDFNTVFLKDNKNLLMHALSLCSVSEDTVKFLLRYVDVNSESVSKFSALEVCLKNDFLESQQKLSLVRLLLQAGARTYALGRMQSTPLHSYMFSLMSYNGIFDENCQAIVKELANASKSIDEKDYLGQSPLMLAVLAFPETEMPYTEMDGENGASRLTLQGENRENETKFEILKYLLQSGADPNLTDDRQRTCIHLAAVTGNLDSLKLLLKYGCRANSIDLVGMTAIYSICAEGDWLSDYDSTEYVLFPIIRELINAGCDINSKAMDQSTVLHYAAAKLPTKIINFLCEMGADVSATDYLKRTPLHMASRNENLGIAHCLAKFKADLNAVNINNDSPLHFACLHGNKQMTKALIDLGADVEAVGDLGIKPVHLAAEDGDAELFQEFVGLANLNARDDYGAMPIHYAASDGNYETVEVLLDLGVDKDVKDANGWSPEDHALYRAHSLKTAQLLSDDENSVKFGKLPPLWFPNRPVIKKEEVADYFDGLIEALRNDGKTGVDLAKQFLSSPGLGQVVLDKGEAKLISDKIVDLMQKVVKRIGQLDEAFESKLLRAGSTFEDVKTGYPDEFDFLCDMVKFSPHIESVVGGETEGFAKIVMKADAPAEVLKFCLRPNRVINAAYFQQKFTELHRRATYDVLSEYNPHIYTGYMLITDNITMFDPLLYQKVKLNGQTLTFRGKEHKFLDISVDINPVFFSPVLPKEFIQKCCLLGDISSRGIYLLPKHCGQFIAFPNETIPHNADFWRYSTQHIEAECMHSLPKIGRDCYTMCKVLRMEPLTCGIELPRYGNEMLTEEQIKRLDGEWLNDGSLPEDEDDKSDETDGTADESSNEEDAEELENEAASGTKHLGTKTNVLSEVDDDQNENNQNIDPDITGRGIGIENDSDEDNKITEDDCGYKIAPCFAPDSDEKESDDLEEDEITAEKAIPSYYLKSIFLKEVEELYKSGQGFNEDSLRIIPWRVYNSLQKACDEEMLSTLFLPEQNMFQRAIKISNALAIDNMRKLYCKNILRMMEALGLKE